MHVSFIPYGERSSVERLLREMECQKHLMPMTKGKKKRGVWTPGQIRELPFGVKEYVFCRESLEMVLRTLGKCQDKDYYGVSFKRVIYTTLRKILRLKKIPKIETKGPLYLWNKAFVSIIVLGIREDGDTVEEQKDDKGWTHEAL